jgi:uncharacterized membrane protein
MTMRDGYGPVGRGGLYKICKMTDYVPRTVFVAMIVYAIVIGFLAVQRYENYSAGMFDLGIIEQAIWNTGHGRILTESVNMAAPVSRMWLNRWELIYLPIAAIHRFFPHPSTALIIQTIVLALGALPLYWLTRDRLGPGLLTNMIPVIYLLYPPLHNANLFDIHGITFATTFLLFAFYYLQKKSWGLFSLFTGLLLICREDASFLVVMLGLYSIFFSREGRVGVIVLSTGALYFMMTQNIHHLRPLLNLPPIENPNTSPGIWGHLGGPSPVSFISTVAADPFLVLNPLLDVANGKLFIKLFSPLCFLPLLSPSTLVIMFPNLLLNMLSSSPVLKNIYHHYTSPITPVIFLGLVLGIQNIRILFSSSERVSRFPRLSYFLVGEKPLAVLLLVASIVSFPLWSIIFRTKEWRVSAHHELIDEVVDIIPSNTSMSAHFFIAPHVAHRESLFLFPDRVGEAKNIVYDLNLPFTRMMSHSSQSNPAAPPMNDTFFSLLHDPRYGIVYARDGVIVLERGADFFEGIRRLAKSKGLGYDPPLSADLETGILRLVGVKEEGLAGYEEEYMHLALYWMVKDRSRIDMSPASFAIGSDGAPHHFEHRLFFGLLEKVEWGEGDIIRDDLFIPIADLPPGKQTLYLESSGGESDDRDLHPVWEFTFDAPK